MPKKLHVRLTRAQAQELHARLEAGGLSRRVRQRIQMVLDADRGEAIETIAYYHQVDVQTVRKWLKAYQRVGLPALADRPRSGHPPALREADWAALAALLDAGAAGERTWTLRQLVEWVAAERGCASALIA
jgi:transposase